MVDDMITITMCGQMPCDCDKAAYEDATCYEDYLMQRAKLQGSCDKQKRIDASCGCKQNDAWRCAVGMTNSGEKTANLTEKQVECIERIHNKHFAG